MNLQALIFDVDGTLAETEELHRRAFNEAFAEAGLDWSWDKALYRELLKTTGGKERIQVYQHDYLGDNKLLEWDEITKLHKSKTDRYVTIMSGGELNLRSGVDRLVAEARKAGLSLAVATTTSFENIDALCLCCWSKSAQDVFDVIAAGDEVKKKKPAPDVFQLALQRLSIPADVCIAFEDSRNGLLSAKAAGLRTIVTPGMYTEDQDFEGAAAIFLDMPRLAEITVALS